jgi:hypothetical protein
MMKPTDPHEGRQRWVHDHQRPMYVQEMADGIKEAFFEDGHPHGRISEDRLRQWGFYPEGETEVDLGRKLVAALPPGRWRFYWEDEVGEYGSLLSSWPTLEGLPEGLEINANGDEPEAELAAMRFIAWCRQGVPTLLEELDRAREKARYMNEIRYIEENQIDENSQEYIQEYSHDDPYKGLERIEREESGEEVTTNG